MVHRAPAADARRAAREKRTRTGVLVALGLDGLLALTLGCAGESGKAADTAVGMPTVASAPLDTPVAAAADSAPATPSAVEAYLRFVEQPRASDAAGAVRDATSEGLRLLASAIEALATRDTLTIATVRPRIDALRARADSTQRVPDAVQQARITSDALVLASDLLQGLQRPGQPALTDRAAEARTAAAVVRSDVPLGDQADAVRRFFTRAAAALRGTVGAPTS